MKKQSKQKKDTIKKDNFAIETDSETVQGQIKLLMVTTYKNGRIYIRQVYTDLFLWDAVFNGELYSSFIIMKPSEGHTELTADETNEVTKMCYAGAAATIDFQRGDSIPESDQHVVDMFEQAKMKINNKDLN